MLKQFFPAKRRVKHRKILATLWRTRMSVVTIKFSWLRKTLPRNSGRGGGSLIWISLSVTSILITSNTFFFTILKNSCHKHPNHKSEVPSTQLPPPSLPHPPTHNPKIALFSQLVKDQVDWCLTTFINYTRNDKLNNVAYTIVDTGGGGGGAAGNAISPAISPTT